MVTETRHLCKLRSALPAIALVLLALLILALPWAHTSAGQGGVAAPAQQQIEVGTASAPASDFEALAGALGHAEAWQRVYGVDMAPPSEAPPSEAPPSQAPEPPSPAQPVEAAITWDTTFARTLYLPLVEKYEVPPLVERRAIWITRYDWTQMGVAPAPESLDAMVAKIAAAGFNTIFFQIRAAGDAYYTPGLEPWASRLSAGPVSEVLGRNPGWDPLARMIALGEAAGLEVHAYVNVYPAWLPPPENQGDLWPPATTPPQMFDWFTYGPQNTSHPGYYGLGWEWRQYQSGEPPLPMPLTPSIYLWATPGRNEVNAHVAAVVRDIVRRYAVHGVHLDLVRYAGPEYSYDPASNAAAGETKTSQRDQWQRDRITALVGQITQETEAIRPGTLVSAAVWPIYLDKWGWGGRNGYTHYYQDSKGWLASGAVDAIVPMLYGSTADDPGRWEILMRDFLADSEGRLVYPGIGTHYSDFNAIAWRIETARAAGAPGHALFSYGALNSQNYWDDLAAGPYQMPAILR